MFKRLCRRRCPASRYRSTADDGPDQRSWSTSHSKPGSGDAASGFRPVHLTPSDRCSVGSLAQVPAYHSGQAHAERRGKLGVRRPIKSPVTRVCRGKRNCSCALVNVVRLNLCDADLSLMSPQRNAAMATHLLQYEHHDSTAFGRQRQKAPGSPSTTRRVLASCL